MVSEVKVFNNLTRKKELFRPITPGEVKFYSCGPTTYDYPHIGNGMALVIGDLIHRVFKSFGYKVTFVRNFTDVDDKIINTANELNVDPIVHSAKFVEECKVDMQSLGMLPATHTPKVTETMDEIIEMIKTLVEKDFAYVSKGEVLFNVPKFKDYGKLSKKDLESLQHGIRVVVGDHKKNPADFVLWKPAKEGEPSWESPWGKGRPGWHIECSAMAKKFLGSNIDIHHGGIDLMFPHHENEIAQSEAANGQQFSNYWCHNNFLNFGKEKMSKSLGNVISIRDFVGKFSGAVLRQILVSSHYRSKLDWSDEVIDRAIRDVERIHRFLVNFEHAKNNNLKSKTDDNMVSDLNQVMIKIKEELANDFNVPGSLSHFFAVIRNFNRDYLSENFDYSSKKPLTNDVITEIDGIVEFIKNSTGLVYDNPQKVLEDINIARKNLNEKASVLSNEDIEKLLQDRINARKQKDWLKSDEIRKSLLEQGIEIKDNPKGTSSWSYK